MTPAQFCFHAYLAHRLLPHGERPTLLHVKIARMLARWQHPEPPHSKLARAVGCCVGTVQNALNRFRKLGMLDWVRRGKVTPWGERLRLSNRYRLLASFLLFSVPPKEERKEILNPISTVGKLLPEQRQALLVKWGLA